MYAVRMFLRHVISFCLFCLVKILSRIFYRMEVGWVNDPGPNPWHHIRLFVFLNHTSLYEPLFVGAIPFKFIWWGAPRVVAPGADKTLARPIVGTFFKLLAPRMISISRKRDQTWENFMDQIEPDSLVVILPEGRMMRATGLDKDGNPMSVRGGISDILENTEDGRMIIAYSGGLHQVQIPGQAFPKIFKTIRVNFELLSIKAYKESIAVAAGETFKVGVIKDLEARMAKYCPRKST